jgi:hypothetical protein
MESPMGPIDPMPHPSTILLWQHKVNLITYRLRAPLCNLVSRFPLSWLR